MPAATWSAPAPAPGTAPTRPPPARRTGGGTTGGDGRGLVQFVLAAHRGQRNTRLFWAACRAYENGIGAALLVPLLEAARTIGLTEHEARATIASAARMTGHRP
ncbi:hypothetical protein RKD32_003575 [Streptomyces sp. SAI-195]